MWGARDGSDRRTVDCIACDTSVPRTEAREYDKEGDRWERHGKEFEYLCKACYRELCHQPRDGLESLLVEIESPEQSRTEFLERYIGAVEERGSSREPES
ncbi:MAG: hypothetical protein ABEJ61_04675 [Haloferacaceae archaeon]